MPQLGNEVHRWSGQVLDTIDYCGFIGRNPGSENVYVTTGDSGQGMTHGAVAGNLIRDSDHDRREPVAGGLRTVPQDDAGIGQFRQ